MSGWCVANALDLTPRERLFAMLAASAADLDGLGIVVSLENYARYHHVLCHNLLFGLLFSFALTCFSTHKAKAFWLFLGLFHLHLILDYFGSGPGWGIYYFWPFSHFNLINPHAWEFFSWQNLLAAGVFLLWTLAIIRQRGRTPLEILMPSLDRQIVQIFRRRA